MIVWIKDFSGNYQTAKMFISIDGQTVPLRQKFGIRCCYPNVIGTPLDLKLPKKVGEDFSPTFDGYDHNRILFPKFHKEFNHKKIGLAARVENQKMIMQVYTDQPGLQFYTGNFLGNGPDFKGNTPQIRQGAFCLEAQTEPNCINHGEGIYDKGETYTQLTVYAFIEK